MADGQPVREISAAALADAVAFGHAVTEPAEPVIIRGLCTGWPAYRAAAESWAVLTRYLLRFDVGSTAEAFVGDTAIAGRYHYGEGLEGFNFKREMLTLSQALDRIDAACADRAASTVYMGSLPASVFVPGFAEENRLALIDRSIEPRLWIGNVSHVACHFDTYDNLACAISGPRRFTLYPPEAIGDLYVGPLDHTMAGQPVSLAAGNTADDPRYPRFAAARNRALIADLAPGDALYLPKLWWHQVQATAPRNLMVNFWWDGFAAGPDAPFTAMMLAMITIAERPEAERAAWRAFFDHYVFRPRGHPLAHLPREKHGILGPLKNNYGSVRAMIMQLLRGR
ncbi:cupin-like domain-containing protein [Hephaestia mangrovi]|uniref:cupin-like domain-containing protein n=1 Tax=Hephaestia mangrovi TaxID=2873268 RepID=UPI001CA602F3|nr:cupin-like domain-containing protein [Hephaestia mangrovi]MBY8827027.1 cupin-like domain-containing protein [Hephaestia mangrovi]